MEKVTLANDIGMQILNAIGDKHVVALQPAHIVIGRRSVAYTSCGHAADYDDLDVFIRLKIVKEGAGNEAI